MSQLTDLKRVFHLDQTVLLSDTDGTGRIRLDAIARILHDIATLDIVDSELSEITCWVLRKTRIDITRFPKYLDKLHIATYCSGSGRYWAQRSTTFSIGNEVVVSATAIWVNVTGVDGGPKAIPEQFFSVYGEELRNTVPSARQSLSTPTYAPNVCEQIELRVSDIDIMNHVNNAIHLALVEEVLSRGMCDILTKSPLKIEIEFSKAMEIPPRCITANLWHPLEDSQPIDEALITLEQQSIRSRTKVLSDANSEN